MLEILLDTLIDIIKLIPFLFITYLIMEYIENKTGNKLKQRIQKSGKYGPFVGGILGIIPQCGFAASSTNLYATGFISIGTLISIYLSTSDEMIPIFISEQVPVDTIFKILSVKLLLGIIFGFLVDIVFKIIKLDKKHEEVDICDEDHCHCDKNGIVKASLIHTLNITLYIFIITLIINIIIGIVGEEAIDGFIQSNNILGPVIASLIGLIPNCAASVIITNLYIHNTINAASLISGLLTGAGVGLIVLFKTNKKHLKENLTIVGLLYVIGVISGWLLELIGFSI